MARRQWFDTPATTTPLAASLLNDLEARKVEVDTQALNVKDYGAVGDGLVDDSLAFQNCIAALPTFLGRKTGKIVVPYGDYIWSTANTLDLTNTSHIEIEGLGGISADGGRPIIRYTPSTGYAIKGNGSYGLTLRNLALGYTHASYASDLITFDLSGTAVAVFFPTIDRCYIAGIEGAVGARSLIRLNNSIVGTIRDSQFSSAQVGIWGFEANVDYSNAMKVEGCFFAQNSTAAIYNPGESWSIDNCTFEPKATGAPSPISRDPSLERSKGLAIRDCWFGDVSASGGTWIYAMAQGLVIEGNTLKMEAGTGNTHITLNWCEGVHISGNRIEGGDTGIDFVTGPVTAIIMEGNNFSGQAVTPINSGSGNLGDYMISSNSGVGSLVGTSVWWAGQPTFSAGVNFVISGQLKIQEGTNAKMGVATLVGGTVVVSTTAVSANSRIFLTCQTPGGTPGFLRVSARTPTSSFTILSSSGTDTSVVGWVIIEAF